MKSAEEKEQAKREKSELAARNLEAARIVAEHDPQLVRAMDWSTFGAVIASLTVLAFSGEFPLALILINAAALLGSLIWGRSDFVTAHRSFFNLFLIVALMYFSWAGFRSGNFILHSVSFLATVQVVKLFQRTEPTDVLQILSLATVGLMVGAVVNPDLVFALSFGASIFLLTWALLFLHFYRDACLQVADALAARVDPGRVLAGLRRKISGRFLFNTSMVGLVLFLSTSMVFLLFPRMGLGFLFKGVEARPVSGFADDITLGHFGTIATDPSLVARVEIPGAMEQAPPFPLYLRGRSLDHYQGGRWRKTYVPRSAIVGAQRGPATLPAAPGRNHRPDRESRIYLEPIPSKTSVVPVFGETRWIDMSPSRGRTGMSPKIQLLQDFDGDIIHDAPSHLRLIYDISYTPDGNILSPAPMQNNQRLLHVPDEIRSKLESLVRNWSINRKGSEAVANIIEARLRRDFKYTLEGDVAPQGNDPVERFLFNTRRGHCEYFASSMALLLRAAGIPSRVVNGFAGGEWNRPGGFFLVRRQNAHSWVEAWIEGSGWRRYDPTPRIFNVEPGGMLAGFRARVDAARLQWMRWVVTYNAQKQLEVFLAMRRTANKAGWKMPGGWNETFKVWFLSILGFVAGIFFVYRVYRSPRWKGSRSKKQAERRLSTIEKLIEKRWRRRAPGEPIRTYLHRCASSMYAESPSAAAALDKTNEHLSKCLYSPYADEQDTQKLEMLIKKLRQELKPIQSFECASSGEGEPPEVRRQKIDNRVASL